VEIEIVSDPNDMKVAAFNLITDFSVSIRSVANNMFAMVVLLTERPGCGLCLRLFHKISLHNNIF
jgi:hypothetical protein